MKFHGHPHVYCIPNRLNNFRIRSKKFIIKNVLSLLLIFISSYSFGQNPSGCIVYPYGAVAAYSKVYSNLTGTNVPSGQNADIVGKPAYDGGTSGNGPGTAANLSCYKQPANTALRECAVRGGAAGSYVWFGGVLAQNYFTCPIDVYIPYLMLAVSILSVLIIREDKMKFY